MKIILSILILSSTVFGGDYIPYQKETVDSSKKMVLFKEKGWVRNNKLNGWQNKSISSNEVFSGCEILKLGHAKLVETPKTHKKPFIYLWDEKEKKIKIICMGFGMGHSAVTSRNRK